MMNNKHADMETAADNMNDDTTDKIAMLNEMHPERSPMKLITMMSLFIGLYIGKMLNVFRKFN